MRRTVRPPNPFLAAERAEVDRLEALAREILDAHPPDESADNEEEVQWRELAHAARQMRPLLEALERAEAAEPGFAPYRAGFRFRFTEAMARVGELCSFARLHPLKQRKIASNPRPHAESPFTEYFKDVVRRKPDVSAKDVEQAMADDARDGGRFELSEDGKAFVTGGVKLSIVSIPSALARARRKL